MMPSTITIPQLNPAVNPKYSHNLYRFLLKMKRHGAPQVIVPNPSDPVRLSATKVGVLTNRDNFFGATLLSVLHQGVKAPLFEGRLDIVMAGYHHHAVSTDFWVQYDKLGKCYLDPDHTMVWKDRDERWKPEGEGQRVCQWCGRRERWTKRTKVERVWVPIENPTAPGTVEQWPVAVPSSVTEQRSVEVKPTHTADCGVALTINDGWIQRPITESIIITRDDARRMAQALLIAADAADQFAEEATTQEEEPHHAG